MIRNSVLRCIKYFCPVNSEQRGWLSAGRCFLRIECLPDIDEGDEHARALAEFWGLDTNVQWLSVSYMCLSPFEPEIQPMVEVSAEDELILACPSELDGEVALKAQS